MMGITIAFLSGILIATLVYAWIWGDDSFYVVQIPKRKDKS